MSGATDRREEEHVPEFFGRVDEKFAEWETDVKLWRTKRMIAFDWDQGCIGAVCVDSRRSL